MKRIILRKLRLTGINKKDAIIEFKPGINIITGDSDTGKTFAYQCLNYIFGAKDEPKEIEESDGYQNISLDFTIDEKSYFLERRIGSSKVLVKYEGVEELLTCQHNATNDNNLSRFLLSRILEKDENIQLVKNQKNKKRTLSFRDLIHLCMVDETEIIAEKSAFQSDQNTERTAKTSVFKYIVTGEDDSLLFAQEDIEDENTKRAGVVQFLKTKKQELNTKIEEIESDKNFKLYSNSKTLTEISIKISEIREKISHINTVIECKQNETSKLKRMCFEDEIKISDFEKIREHYLQEMKKYGAMNTYADFIQQLPTLNCPVCGNTFKKDECFSDSDLDELFLYFKRQANDLLSKEKDVLKAICDVRSRLNTNKKQIEDLDLDINNLKEQVSKLEVTLSEYNQNIVLLRKLDSMSKAIEIYRSELINVEGDIVAYGEKLKAAKAERRIIGDAIFSEYCKKVEIVLEQWGFNHNLKVTFDYNTLDFYIGNKKRTSWGKGYRAFFMSAMSIALMRFCCENNKPHPGFVVLDSPLVSLKERKKDTHGEWIEDYMEKLMIENISQSDDKTQVIIFENKNLNFAKNINYIEFNHDGNGRKGFIPSQI